MTASSTFLQTVWYTASVDFGVVLSGQALLELDDGATVVLDVGDTYIQNGTRHRWSNPGDEPAVLAVALVGAEHADVDAPRPTQ